MHPLLDFFGLLLFNCFPTMSQRLLSLTIELSHSQFRDIVNSAFNQFAINEDKNFLFFISVERTKIKTNCGRGFDCFRDAQHCRVVRLKVTRFIQAYQSARNITQRCVVGWV